MAVVVIVNITLFTDQNIPRSRMPLAVVAGMKTPNDYAEPTKLKAKQPRTEQDITKKRY